MCLLSRTKDDVSFFYIWPFPNRLLNKFIDKCIINVLLILDYFLLKYKRRASNWHPSTLKNRIFAYLWLNILPLTGIYYTLLYSGNLCRVSTCNLRNFLVVDFWKHYTIYTKLVLHMPNWAHIFINRLLLKIQLYEINSFNARPYGKLHSSFTWLVKIVKSYKDKNLNYMTKN